MDNTTKDTLARKLLGAEHADKYTEPSREYDTAFKVDSKYIDTLPDLQNGANQIIKKIEQVGMHNFRLPVTYSKKDGTTVTLETSVTGTASVEAETKGLNMSRIIRSFYDHKNKVFSLETLKDVLVDYRQKIGSFEASILLKISYPMIMKSLRSDNEGWVYYDVILEGNMDAAGNFRKVIHLDFVYSSACPCSTELSEHARKYRGVAAIPHSQRSVARISAEYDQHVWIEDLVDICRDAMKTETQIIVKREDEQAFAELNAANVKFVEDAIRMFSEKLDLNKNITDYRAIANHLESLHPSDVIAIVTKGVPNSKFSSIVSYHEARSLVR